MLILAQLGPEEQISPAQRLLAGTNWSECGLTRVFWPETRVAALRRRPLDVWCCASSSSCYQKSTLKKGSPPHQSYQYVTRPAPGPACSPGAAARAAGRPWARPRARRTRQRRPQRRRRPAAAGGAPRLREQPHRSRRPAGAGAFRSRQTARTRRRHRPPRRLPLAGERPVCPRCGAAGRAESNPHRPRGPRRFRCGSTRGACGGKERECGERGRRGRARARGTYASFPLWRMLADHFRSRLSHDTPENMLLEVVLFGRSCAPDRTLAFTCVRPRAR